MRCQNGVSRQTDYHQLLDSLPGKEIEHTVTVKTAETLLQESGSRMVVLDVLDALPYVEVDTKVVGVVPIIEPRDSGLRSQG